MKRITLGIVALGLAACAPQALPVEPAPQAAIVMETPMVTETPEAVPTPTGMPLEVRFNFPAGQQDYQVPLSLTQGGDEFSAYHAFTRAAANESLALETQWFDFDGDPSVNESAWIDSVAGVKTSADWAQYWQFSVNNTPALLGVSGYVPQQGDVLSLDYKESPAQDALEWLLDHQEESGALGGNYFQHAFATMALHSSAATEAAARAERHLLIADDAHGSLYSAVQALASDGVPSGIAAELLEAQRTDGGWRSGTPESDVDTTAWVMLALVRSGEGVPESAVRYLLNAQHPDGSWGYNAEDPGNSLDFTEEALLALRAAGYSGEAADNGLAWLRERQTPEGCFVDGFRTSLGAMALVAYDDSAAQKALECLPTQQNGDGSFGRQSNRSNAMDTALALLALDGESVLRGE